MHVMTQSDQTGGGGSPEINESAIHPWPDEENTTDEEAPGADLSRMSPDDLDALEVELTALVEPRLRTDEDAALRLARDRRIVQMLGDTGYQGERFRRLYRKLGEQLVEYAWPIIGAWIKSQEIFRKCGRYRSGMIRPEDWRRPSDQERAEIVSDTLADALLWLAESGLPQGKWNPELGATLRTYFVGACLHRFPRVYRKWFREHELHRTLQLPTDDNAEWAPWLHDTRAVDPEHCALIQDEVSRALRALPQPLDEVVVRRGAGYTEEEAAAAVGLTSNAVQSRLARYRRRHRPSDNVVTADPGMGCAPVEGLNMDLRGERREEK